MKMIKLYEYFALILIVIGLGWLSWIPVASAQCSVEADWDSYRIQAGDTLESIALQYEITVAQLLQGNCISSDNRLLVGGYLYVPHRPFAEAQFPQPPAHSLETNATYQQFETGFMIWRSDSGDIWVFLNDGRVFSYPVRVYGGLSGDARYTGVPIPVGRNLPILGFKKVYDNFRDVRTGLGWAIGGERGYRVQLQILGDSFAMTLADNRTVHIRSNGAWEYDSSIVISISPLFPTAVPPTLTGGETIYQSFERGFMVRNAGANCVYAYSDEDQNIILVPILGPSSIYHYCIEFDTLPETSAGSPPPDGLIEPTGAFGHVWGFYPNVREVLGWATASEQMYTGQMPPLESSLGGGPFSMPQAPLPDGRVLYCGMRAATAGTCSIR